MKVRKFIDKTYSDEYDVLIIKAEAPKVTTLYEKRKIFEFFQMCANANGGFVIQRYFERALETWALKRVTSATEREEFSNGIQRHYFFEKFTESKIRIYFNYVFKEFENYGLIEYGKVYINKDGKGRSQLYRSIKITDKGARAIM